MIIELKITNLNDWNIIQPLLKRLKISFTQKDLEQTPIVEESTALYKKKEPTPSINNKQNLELDNAVVWSPYDAYDAAEVLLQAMKNNTPSTTN